MDPFVLTYYAVVCGALAGVLPPGIPWLARLVFGVLVGLISATGLPIIRGWLGF